MKVITIGNSVIDYYPDLNKMYPGGSSLNVSVFCKRFGAKQSAFIGMIGTDEEGEHIEKVLNKEQINKDRIRKVVGKSSKVTIKQTPDGDRIIDKWDKGVQSLVTIQLNEDDLKYIALYDVLHIGLNSFLDDQLKKLSNRISLSYDFSTTRDQAHLQAVCPYLEYAFFSGSDLSPAECNELIKQVHEYGTKYVIVTRGKYGAILSDFKTIYTETIDEKMVKDTLGAGDSFIAMILTNINQSTNLSNLLKESTAMATETCVNVGAFGHAFLVNN